MIEHYLDVLTKGKKKETPYIPQEAYSLKHVFQGLQSSPSKQISYEDIFQEVKTLRTDVNTLKSKDISISDLHSEIHILKEEVKFLRNFIQIETNISVEQEENPKDNTFLNIIDKITYKKWHSHSYKLMRMPFLIGNQYIRCSYSKHPNSWL